MMVMIYNEKDTTGPGYLIQVLFLEHSLYFSNKRHLAIG